jgi:hypothetical protein
MTKPIIALPDTNLSVMEQLHTYRFLTPSQMVRLGITSHMNSLRRTLRRFEIGRKYVDYTEFGVFQKLGRLPRVYYLTEGGAKYLAEAWRVDPKEINYPRGVKLFSRDYFHRSATIDFHIELRMFAERFHANVEFFHTYFDTKGANRAEDPENRLQRLSKVPLGKDGFFIPDSIFSLRTADGERYLYAVEIYNGIDTKRVHTQMEKHIIALGEGKISDLYGFPNAHRVLCIFESDAALMAAEKRLREDELFSEQMRKQFALSTLSRLRGNFACNWQFLEKGRNTIFDTKKAGKAHEGDRKIFESLRV